MPYHEEFYDNPEIRAKYIAHRTQPDNPNDTLERPIFLELVDNFNQLDIIDLGCRDASFGKEALLQRARSYIGIEHYFIEVIAVGIRHGRWGGSGDTSILSSLNPRLL